MLKVIIVGAGLTGLLLAQGLRTSGIESVVYERDSEERFIHGQREWGMSMHWGGDFLARALPPDLRARLGEIDCDAFYDSSKDTGFVQCNGKTGEVILVMPSTMPRRVSRRKLRMLLMTGVNIQYGKTFASFEVGSTEVIAGFEDGSSVTGSLLVGCDGSKSRVRKLMVGREACNLADAYITIINFPYKYNPSDAQHLRIIHPVFKVCYHPELNQMYLLCILAVPDPEKPETWEFQNLISWKGPPYAEDLKDPIERMKFFKSHGSQYAEPWRTAALGVSDDTIFPIDSGQYLAPPDGIGRQSIVTLAEDAAHPMRPHRGQGLKNALQDAFEIIEVLKAVEKKEKSLQDGIFDYVKEMSSRGGQEVQVSLKQAQMAHDWKTLSQSPMFKIGANKQTSS